MKSKVLIYFLPVILVAILLYGYSNQDDPYTDAAPYSDASSKINTVNSAPGDTLYTFIVPNQIILGVNKLGNSPRLAFTSGGQSSAVLTDNIWIRTTLRGVRIDSFPQVNNTAGQGFGFRDLAWDGRYLLTADNNQIRRIDTTTFTEPIPRITVATTLNRGLAWSSINRIWTSDFTTAPVRMVDTTGAIVKVLGVPTVAPYGLGADRWTSRNRMWLWYAEPSTTGQPCKLSKVDTSNGAIVQTYTYNFGTAVSGGLDIINDHPEYPGRVIAITACQRFPTSLVAVIDLGPDSTITPPTPGDTTLVLIHDTVGTVPAPRQADKDTLYKYLRPLVRNYRVQKFDSNTTFPNLSNFKTIIAQETSFDTPIMRYFGVTARGQLKTWLASGNAANKKALIMIGADQAYNYSRALSPAQDTNFAQTYGKFIYRVDDATLGGVSDAIVGAVIDNGNVRTLNPAPPGGAYWPDGCGIVPGGSSILYRYQNGGTTDTLAAIGNVQAGFVVASVFQDPRYFNGGFGQVLTAVVGWVRANGGVITNVNNNISSLIPHQYNLEQNYPNPFNPATKIAYSIPKTGLVTLKVYDILGKEVATLVNEIKNAGSYELNFNASFLSSGVYFYRIKSGDFIDTKKMFLLK